jgi:hypothetical protein
MLKKTKLLFILFLLPTFIFAQEENYVANVSSVRFELQKIKAIGSELRVYFLITNTATEDVELTLRANEHLLWDGLGNEYSSNTEIIANEVMKSSSFVKKNFISGIPIKACFVFKDNNAFEVKNIELLQIKTNLGNIRINNIPVPFGVQPNPIKDNNTIEIEDNVFLKITDVQSEGENLRMYFLTENQNAKDVEVRLRANSQRIIDDKGTVFTSNLMEYASEIRKSTSMQSTNLVQDVPVKGYFEFPGAANIQAISLFDMQCFNNSYRLKNLNLGE